MKEEFRTWNPRGTSLNRVTQIQKIIATYAAQGYKLTLRQLYYQLVSADIIPNQQKEYAKLSDILTNARMAGLVDWNAIEDRIRRPFLPYWCIDPADAIKETVEAYRRNRQEGQEVYIELWVEKDAISGVLKRITSKYHIHLMVNRGYSSASAMYDAANRLKEAMSNGQTCHILYLGDHDPSGMDMDRDIRDRLTEFGAEVEVTRIALTDDQIKKYTPPPNPTKMTDSRSEKYTETYGNTCWEVDALKPEVLVQIVEDAITDKIDLEVFQEQLEKERADKEKLSRFAETLDD